jgi:hypothetical protein
MVNSAMLLQEKIGKEHIIMFSVINMFGLLSISHLRETSR